MDEYGWILCFILTFTLIGILLVDTMSAHDLGNKPWIVSIIKWLLCPLWLPIILLLRRHARKGWARTTLCEHAEYQHRQLVDGYVRGHEALIEAGIHGNYLPVNINDDKAIDRYVRENRHENP